MGSFSNSKFELLVVHGGSEVALRSSPTKDQESGLTKYTIRSRCFVKLANSSVRRVYSICEADFQPGLRLTLFSCRRCHWSREFAGTFLKPPRDVGSRMIKQ